MYLLSPLRVRLELFVRPAAPPAPADSQAEDQQEGDGHPHQAPDQGLLGDLLPHRHPRPVQLLPVLVLQFEDVVPPGLLLVDTQDVEDGDVAVVGGAVPLLLHGVGVVAGAGHQGELVLLALDLPGLFGQRRPAELHLNLGVRSLREEEMLVVSVDPGRSRHTQTDRLAAAGGDGVGGLAVVLALVLVPHLLQPDRLLVTDGDGAPGGVLDPPEGGGGTGLGLAAELQAGAQQLVHCPGTGRDGHQTGAD